jgi:hypothetical protein
MEAFPKRLVVVASIMDILILVCFNVKGCFANRKT